MTTSGNLTVNHKLDYVFQVSDILASSKVLLYILIILGMSIILRLICIQLKYAFLYYPFVLVCSFFYGLLMGYKKNFSTHVMNLTQETNANLFVLLFFPVMLFHTAFSMDYHGFGHSTTQVLILSVLGFPLQSALLTLLLTYSNFRPDKWTLEVTIIFCIICSIIEPETVLQELNKTQARVKHIQLLLQGEQLASLAMATICYTITFEYYFGSHPSINFIFITILWHILGGIIGATFGYIMGYIFVHNAHDLDVAVSLTAFAGFFSFYIGHMYIHQAGVVVTIVTGVLLSPAKIKTTSDIETYLSIFWEWLSFISNTVSFSYPGILIGLNPEYLTVSDVANIFIVLALCGCCRFILYISMRPLLLKVGKPLSWANIAVVVASPYRASPALIVAMLYRQYSPEQGHQVLTFIAILCLMSSIINGFAIPALLKQLGMYDLTHARAMNMKHAIAHVLESRNKAIHSLKMDRVVADANWLIVDQSTVIENKNNWMSWEGEEDLTVEAHRAICADCGLENEVIPTHKEINDLEIEGKHRILKAKLVSMWRQYETGTLTKRSIRILSTLLQNAMEKPNPWLDVNDLELYWEPPKYVKRVKYCLEFILRSLPKKLEHAPAQKWRAVVFRLINGLLYKLISTFLTALDTFFILNFCFHECWGESVNIPVPALQIFDIIFYVYFLIEFACLIFVFGRKVYYKKFYHKLDFLCNVLLRSCEIFMGIQLYFIHGERADFLHRLNFVMRFTKLMLILRLNRLYIVIELVIWKLLHIFEIRLDNTLVQYYDIGKAFLIANDRTLKYLRHIVQDKTVYTKLRRDLEDDRKRVAKSVGIIQNERPNVAATIKTQHAIKQVLNEMNDSILVIYDEGLLDVIEKKYLNSAMDHTRKLRKYLEVITPCIPQLIFLGAPWLHDEFHTSEYLLSHARLQTYSCEDLIITAGDDPVGVFVIVSGVVKCVYKSSRTTIENCRKYGALPNCDFRVSLKLDEIEEEYVVCGNIIGEIGAVTGRKVDMTVICQSEVQAYYIPWHIMWNALFEMDNTSSLYTKIWKTIGVRIALLILQYVPNFQGWLREKTLLYLERSFVPVLSGIEELFVNEMVSDIILIEGMIMDGNTRSIYFAPYYIPRTTNKLILPGTSKWTTDPKYDTRLLIIPSENMDEGDVMTSGGIVRDGCVEEPDVVSITSFARWKTTAPSLKCKKDPKRRLEFHKKVLRHVSRVLSESVDSTETFSTDSDIPLMKIFQSHVKTAVRMKPENRINYQNEFNTIDDVLEKSDEANEEDHTDYSRYGILLRKKLTKKIRKQKQNTVNMGTQTDLRSTFPRTEEEIDDDESDNTIENIPQFSRRSIRSKVL